jgi:hypothetical protein
LNAISRRMVGRTMRFWELTFCQEASFTTTDPPADTRSPFEKIFPDISN